MDQPKLALGIHWESQNASGVAVALDRKTATVLNDDGTTRHLDRIFVCYLDDILTLLPEQEIPAARARW